MTLIKKIIFIFVPGLVVAIPFLIYATYQNLVQNDKSFEMFLFSFSGFISVTICLWISARKIELKKIRNDYSHSITLNIFCYFLFGLIFMVIEPFQRVEIDMAVFGKLGALFLLIFGMIFFYFLLPGIFLVIWWAVPLHVYWMNRYRTMLNKYFVRPV